jgi:hypothetical protein
VTSLAIVAGAKVWIVLAAGLTVWSAAVLLSRGALFGPRAIVRWLLGAWSPRIMVLAIWGLAGWHIFCQRP